MNEILGVWRFLRLLFRKPIYGILCTPHQGNPILVAFSGKAGCGKSTIADRLIANYGFVKFSFAENLKALAWTYFPSIMSMKKEVFRKLLQEIGELFRKWNPDVWVNIVVSYVNSHLLAHPDTRIVIDDLRYENELHALKLLGFQCIRIERDPELRRKWGYNVDDPHQSEIQLDQCEDWDLIITNNDKYPFKQALHIISDFLRLNRRNRLV